MHKRDFLKILGGGTILAVAPGCTVLRPTPERALAPDGGAVRMLARLGHAAPVPPSPRWSLDAVPARRA